jgi:hypothetical protein
MTNINEVQVQVQVSFAINPISKHLQDSLRKKLVQIAQQYLQIGESLDLLFDYAGFEKCITGISYSNEGDGFDKRISEVAKLIDAELTVWMLTNNCNTTAVV